MDESLIDNIAEKVLARMEEKKAAERQEEGKDPFDEALEKLTEGETEPGGETGTEARVVPAEGQTEALAVWIRLWQQGF